MSMSDIIAFCLMLNLVGFANISYSKENNSKAKWSFKWNLSLGKKTQENIKVSKELKAKKDKKGKKK